ncbi:hypothetical protein IMZ48_16660 [Candidatus Bathyarchaeota archaeon]|nr:hypothetical protein [Candidatus Bathyarchaeota archaeon]
MLFILVAHPSLPRRTPEHPRPRPNELSPQQTVAQPGPLHDPDRSRSIAEPTIPLLAPEPQRPHPRRRP